MQLYRVRTRIEEGARYGTAVQKFNKNRDLFAGAIMSRMKTTVCFTTQSAKRKEMELSLHWHTKAAVVVPE